MASISDDPKPEDFDDESIYNSYESAVLNLDTKNIIVDFSRDKASAVRNVDHTFMQHSLESKQVDDGRTKWISIWGPWRQKEVVNVLSDRYGFSPRLRGLMRSKPDLLELTPIVAATNPGRLLKILHSPRTENFKIVDNQSDDIEMTDGASKADPSVIDLNHYRLIDNVWHFFSVDWGSKFLCIGYNSVCNPKTQKPAQNDSPGPAEYQIHSTDRPDGVRLWTWLVLCNDGTVISIHENPSKERLNSLNAEDESAALKLTRGNFLNAFRQLSNANDASKITNPIMTLSMRSGSETLLGNMTSTADAPGLLFYYLYDDWFASYSLVAREKHQYGAKLEGLRAKMFQKPDVGRIERLHHIGRQLAVLKRMHESYAMIITRILDRQKPMTPSLLPPDAQSSVDPPSAQAIGVPLSSAAIVRFERLKDRINHFALSEIQDCLDEKEALVFLNFNLITLKQSQAVERLTRITILLAKVTILFMPVSLMTAVFSTNVNGLSDAYDSKTYWAAFAIVMFLSFIFLVIFGQLSGTLEGKPIYRSLTETFYDHAIRYRRRRKNF